MIMQHAILIKKNYCKPFFHILKQPFLYSTSPAFHAWEGFYIDHDRITASFSLDFNSFHEPFL